MAKKDIGISNTHLNQLIQGVITHGSHLELSDTLYTQQVGHFLDSMGLQFPVPERPYKEGTVRIKI